MKLYTVMLIQLIIWSCYTLIEWLSKYDQLIYKVIMFLIFFYMAINIGNYLMKSKRKTLLATCMSLSLYGSIHLVMAILTN
ncbi:hypothetical protein J2S17_004331 [Cytobacillus purgationiresistens]|uniref:Group-specific protein n=1 Tax=Cytobacillus purgationiresistens TaxID=863449 RepID=A0ABU0AMF2_9BACI|nr:hypothetical protein [Cytobacillus purgationiresistens]